MTNNDVLRRLRYTLHLSDEAAANLFALGGQRAFPEEVASWTLPDGHPGLAPMSDYALDVFLNGLIVDKRGTRNGGPPPGQDRLSNNDILRKLKIAFALKSHEVVALYTLAGRRVSEHEVTAFFRHPGSRQYRALNDQYLRWFLEGLQRSYGGA